MRDLRVRIGLWTALIFAAVLQACPRAQDHFPQTNRCKVGAMWVNCPNPEASPTDSFTLTALVKETDDYDPRIAFFTLTHAEVAFTIGVDRSRTLYDYLHKHAGERVAVTFDAAR